MKQQTRGYYPWWHFLGTASESLLTCFSLEPLLCSGCCWEDYSLWTLGTSTIWPVRYKPELPLGKHWPMEDSGSRHIKSLSISSSLSIWGHQFSSVQSLSRVRLCDPMNCSTPGLPVHHQLPEFTQTHVHQVCDAIQPSHPLSSSFPPAPNPSQHQSLFQ